MALGFGGGGGNFVAKLESLFSFFCIWSYETFGCFKKVLGVG